MSTCGRLSIGLATFLRIFLPYTYLLSVTTFGYRRLPHYHAVGQPLFVTWRLDGSLPHNRRFPSAIASGQAFLAMDRVLDMASAGPRFLSMPEVATMVKDAIRYRDRHLKHYQLHAFVVMPNHVHLSKNTRKTGRVRALCASDDPAGRGFERDAIAQEIHCPGGQPNPGSYRPAVLAGREL